MLAALAALVLPYSKPVTALAAYAGSVFVGTSRGEVDQVSSDGSILRSLAGRGKEPVAFVSASPYGVCWIDGKGGAIREKASAATPSPVTLHISTRARESAVKFQPEKPIRRLAWIAGKIAVCYDLGVSYFDQKGISLPLAAAIPAAVAGLAKDAALWVREQPDGTELAVFAKPHSVRRNEANQKDPLVSLFTAFQVGEWQWVRLGGFASTALDAFPDGELQADEEGKIAADAKFLVLSDRIGLADDGVVLREPEAILNAPIYKDNFEISRSLPNAVPGDSLWFGAGGTSAWWWTGAALVRQDRLSKESTAYLPWLGNEPSAFAADSNGLWVGAKSGLSFVDPSRASPGFIRVPLAEESNTAADANAKKLTDAIFAWRFADASKAGDDGGVMVASVYSVLGLKLPESAAEQMRSGTPVTDELRFGDVLLTPKAGAIYLGNGVTVEMRGGRVQNGELWTLGKRTVRRFRP